MSIGGFFRRKQEGNVGDLAGSMVCLLGMTIVMLAYMNNVMLLQKKLLVGQIARKYILRMETVGCLEDEDEDQMSAELLEAGVTQLNLEGTTRTPVSYGTPIRLSIQGMLGEEYEIAETRVSTAKH